VAVRPAGTHYIVQLEGSEVEARGIVIATGVRDVLPDTPGFGELWGSGVFHCPYCHGWEVANQPLGIYARADREAALHFAILIRGWTRDLILFTDGPSELSADDLKKMEANGIAVREERLERLIGSHGLEAVVLEGGEVVPRAGLFMRPKQEQHSDIAAALGCAITDQGRIEADVLGRTGVPRVFVAGDIVVPAQSVIAAAASGTMAGAGLNHDLLAEEFESGSRRS
jgi:thioredoxin reductase